MLLHLPVAKKQLHSTLNSLIFQIPISQFLHCGKPNFPSAGPIFVFSAEEDYVFSAEEDDEEEDEELESNGRTRSRATHVGGGCDSASVRLHQYIGGAPDFQIVWFKFCRFLSKFPDVQIFFGLSFQISRLNLEISKSGI